MTIDYNLTGWIFSILPIFLLIMAIIYRNKIKKVIVEFFVALLIMVLLLLISGFAIAVLNISPFLIVFLLAGIFLLYKLGKLNFRDLVFVAIFLLLVLIYEIYGYFGNAELIVFIIGLIVVMVINIKGVGKDDSVPYQA